MEKTKCEELNGEPTSNLNWHICPGSSKNNQYDFAKSFKDVCEKYVLVSNDALVHTVESVLPAVHFEKPPFPTRIKEHSIVANVVNKSERKAYEPYEQLELPLQ